MRLHSSYLIWLILTAFSFGCQSSSKKNHEVFFAQKLKINIGDEPQTLDPRKARDLKSQSIARMLFDGLTRINPEEKAELALAEKCDISTDLKTYTFHLKDSVWSNADPLTASDFAYAWKKILSPDFPSDVAFHLYVIKNAKAAKEGKIGVDEIGVRVLNSKTLVIELENPTPYFLELIALPAFFPVNQRVDEKTPSWAQNAATYVGNGPFQLAQWRHQAGLTINKNDKYWDSESVKITSIELEILQADTELKLFEKNELDWAGSPFSTLPSDSIKALRKDNSLKTKELLGTYFIRTNTGKTPFNDVKIRRALGLVIDRRAIVDYIAQGNQVPATGLVPTSLKLQKEVYFQDADLSSARKLFSEGIETLLLKLEELPEIFLLYRTGERSHLIAQVLQQRWFEAFGLRVKLESTEGKVYWDRMSKQDYHLALADWIADFADPINFLEIFKYRNGGSNNTLWENPSYVALLDRSAQMTDQGQRRQILTKAEQILIQEMPIIPIFYYTMLYVSQPYLKNVVLSSMGQIDFKWAFIELEVGE